MAFFFHDFFFHFAWLHLSLNLGFVCIILLSSLSHFQLYPFAFVVALNTFYLEGICLPSLCIFLSHSLILLATHNSHQSGNCLYLFHRGWTCYLPEQFPSIGIQSVWAELLLARCIILTKVSEPQMHWLANSMLAKRLTMALVHRRNDRQSRFGRSDDCHQFVLFLYHFA